MDVSFGLFCAKITFIQCLKKVQLRHGVLHDHGVLVPNVIVHCKDPLASKTLEEVTTDPRLKLEGARHRGGSYLSPEWRVHFEVWRGETLW